jgi:hypothetical protein
MQRLSWVFAATIPLEMLENCITCGVKNRQLRSTKGGAGLLHRRRVPGEK